jgi:hypothetical protein
MGVLNSDLAALASNSYRSNRDLENIVTLTPNVFTGMRAKGEPCPLHRRKEAKSNARTASILIQIKDDGIGC